MTQCVSRVNTRLRYVQKSTVMLGSPRTEQMVLASTSLKVFVKYVTIDLNALNGVLPMNGTEFGVDSPLPKERKSVVKEN